MRWAMLVALAPALAGCGDDGGGGAEADAAVTVVDAATAAQDAAATDARPQTDARVALDAALPDAAPDASPSLLPDLTGEAITRDALYYAVQFCNRGDGVGDRTPFRVRLSNATNGATFQTSAFFVAPPPGECAMTGGITCALIDDAGCDVRGTVIAVIDSDDSVAELDETNNAIGVAF